MRAGIDEIHETGAAVELGKEDGSIGLGFRGFDPLKASSDVAVVGASFAKDPTAIAARPHGCYFYVRERERERPVNSEKRKMAVEMGI